MRPHPDTVNMVLARDMNRCARCGDRVRGLRGHDWSVHHRQPAGMGGSKRSDAHDTANLILLCGSGVSKCHGWVESHRTASYDAGWLVHRPTPPADVAVRHAAHDGTVYLTADGGISPVEVAA